VSESGLQSGHILGLRSMPVDDIHRVIRTADGMKEILGREIRKVPTLRGRTVVTLFYEPSTRTRSSFETAARIMSADISSLAVAASSVVKGESLRDTVLTLRSLAMDVLVMRHNQAGAAHLASEISLCPVINAGDGFNEHPTQGLLDMYTMRQRFGQIEGLKVAIVGDILHSRVARSNVWALSKIGCDVRLCGPPTMLPPGLEAPGARMTPRLADAIEGADVVMVLRIQKERQDAGLFPSLREYHSLYGITKERLRLAAPGAIVLHPGPINRGVEMDADVAEGPQSMVTDQVTNGLAIRMALLYLLLGGKSNDSMVG
jgi:aspartate carbamoyltransferase catalytic subunit